MIRSPRLFFSYSFDDDTKNVADVVFDVAKEEEFEIITGRPPDPNPPQEFVKSKILSCDCFAAVMTARGQTTSASSWIHNEIGIAYAFDLPLLICCEQSVGDLGLSGVATSHLQFSKTDLRKFRDELRHYLREFRQNPYLRSKVGISGFVRDLSKRAVEGRSLSPHDHKEALDRLAQLVEPLIAGTQARQFSFGESEEFVARHAKHLDQKRAIARFVVDELVAGQAEGDHPDEPRQWLFVDSGTVTFTISEEIVTRAESIAVMTNNLASCRIFSLIPRYPCLIVPGELETRYVAAVGTETTEFLKRRLTEEKSEKPIGLALLAATSLTAADGICGNDQRHNELKQVVLSLCPESVIVCEGEKLLEAGGTPIFGSRKGWRDSVAEAHRQARRIRLVTHEPDNFDLLPLAQRNYFERQIIDFRTLLGKDAVTVLSTREASKLSRSAGVS